MLNSALPQRFRPALKPRIVVHVYRSLAAALALLQFVRRNRVERLQFVQHNRVAEKDEVQRHQVNTIPRAASRSCGAARSGPRDRSLGVHLVARVPGSSHQRRDSIAGRQHSLRGILLRHRGRRLPVGASGPSLHASALSSRGRAAGAGRAAAGRRSREGHGPAAASAARATPGVQVSIRTWRRATA